MKSGTIGEYTTNLRQRLGETLCLQDAEEIAAEAHNHLSERATELRASGLSAAESDRQTVEEFGDLDELAVELASGYPPKTPVDPARLRWLPEIGVSVVLALAIYSFSIYGGARGLEAASQNVIISMPMFMIPGISSGLGRLKYRRLRPVSVLTRTASYGFALNLVGTVCLVVLEATGRATLISMFPMMYLFSAVTVVMYLVMRVTFTDGKFYMYIRKMLRVR